MTSSWQFARASAAAALPALREEWHRLLSATPYPLPYQSPPWLEAYLRHWPAESACVLLVTARRQGELRAVLPLVLRSKGRGPLKLGIAELLHNEHMPLADIAAAPEDASLWPALLAWLRGPSGLRFARLDLPGVADDSTLGTWLSSTSTPGQSSVVSAETARIDTRGDYDSLIKAASSKHRNNLARSSKRAEAIGPLRYQRFSGDTLLTEGLPLLLEIESSGWKGRSGTAIGSDAPLERFYRAAIEGLASRGQCSIGVLWFGDRPAAATLLLVGGRVAYGHKLGYREEWAAMGPGHLLMREVIKAACEDPRLDAVSLVLHPPWSDVWRPVLTPVRIHTLYSPSFSGRLAAWLAARRRAAAVDAPSGPVAPRALTVESANAANAANATNAA